MNPCEEIVKLSNWKWLQGMISTDGKMFVEYADCDEAAWLQVAEDGCDWEELDDKYPDLYNSTTAFIVLSLIESIIKQCVWIETWGQKYIVYTIEIEQNMSFRKALYSADTRADALLGALKSLI